MHKPLPYRYIANLRLSSWFFLAFALIACDDQPKDVKSSEHRKSERESAFNREAGADSVLKNSPLEAISTYLDGFHFYSGNMQAQVQAHHYVTKMNDEFMQAIIYDGNTSDAKLIGIEYIISERLFNNLPPEEKFYGTVIITRLNPVHSPLTG